MSRFHADVDFLHISCLFNSLDVSHGDANLLENVFQKMLYTETYKTIQNSRTY